MESVVKKDCVNYEMLLVGKCPFMKLGYCINCKEYVPKMKRKDKVNRQIDVNIFFEKTVCHLADAIIDEAFDFCYNKFRQYPNIQTIKGVRDRFKYE